MHFPKWKIFAVIAVCVWAIAQSSTNFFTEAQRQNMKFLPQATVKLGLDLQGGSYLLLKVDFQHFLKEHFDARLDDIRKKFRTEKIGYLNLRVAAGKDDSTNITFTSRDPKQNDDVIKALKDISRDFEVSVEGEDDFVISYSGEYLKKLQKDVLEKSIEIVRRRVDETGTAINSMKKGDKVEIKGTSEKGTKSTDIYSLKGFGLAYDKMISSCGKAAEAKPAAKAAAPVKATKSTATSTKTTTTTTTTTKAPAKATAAKKTVKKKKKTTKAKTPAKQTAPADKSTDKPAESTTAPAPAATESTDN